MRYYIKKRKHRNGVRPQRKGTLKVRMITLPTHFDNAQATINACLKMNRATLDALKLPYGSAEKDRKWEYVDLLGGQVDMMNKASDFFAHIQPGKYCRLKPEGN